jgi:hypothetical protein
VTAWGVKFQLSDALADKVNTFSETSYGATRVTLVLKDGRQLPGVAIAGSRDVIKARRAEDESVLAKLTASDILDILPEP